MYIRFISPHLSVGFARKFVIDVTIREIKYLIFIKMVTGNWEVGTGKWWLRGMVGELLMHEFKIRVEVIV